MGRVIANLGEGSKIELNHAVTRRRYFDPKDGTWTLPLPAGPWESYYVSKGFRLTAPDGSKPPKIEGGE